MMKFTIAATILAACWVASEGFVPAAVPATRSLSKRTTLRAENDEELNLYETAKDITTGPLEGAKRLVEDVFEGGHVFDGGVDRLRDNTNPGAGTAHSSPNNAEETRIPDPHGGDIINSPLKASRFRVDQSKEGETAARAYEEPLPPKNTQPASSQSWSIPSDFESKLGSGKQVVKERAEGYMSGTVTAHDMAVTLRQAGVPTETVLEMVSTMPAGQKKADLFKLFTQF